jgi:hypothetical protein
MATKIQVRRDSSSNWTILNPGLSEGEIGFETNTGKFKIGNGSSAWSDLDYFDVEVDLSAYLTQASASTTYQQKVANVSDTEIGYLDGVTSLIQTQIDSKNSKYLNVVPAKTSNYTISSGDEVSLIELNGTFTVSIPTDSTFNFPIGSQINILNIGTGVITIAAVTPGTTTVNATPGLKLRAQWSSATLIKRAENNWIVIGDLIA